MTTLAQNCVPSLRTRQPSSSKRPSACGDLEFVSGPAPVDGFLGVEAGEVLADDLLGPVALDALGPWIPRGDVALWVEQEDRIVRGPFDQEPEPLLAAAQRLLGLLACGQVTSDLREATQVAFPVPQGRDDDVRPKQRAVLPHSPALVLEAAFGLGDLEFVSGPAPVDGLLGVEAGEVLTDDLLSPVALDALGPGVPGRTWPCGSSMKMA